MKDFIKIFLGISALAAAFLFGRNYGEKAYSEGAEHRSLVRATEELNFAKSEFENAKAKLQNIADQAETKKTDELLAQILHVFLTDLGIRIQNKDAILRRAENKAETQTAIKPSAAPAAPSEKDSEPVVHVKTAEKDMWSKGKTNKFKSFEWMVQNSSGDRGTLRDLKKVQIKNLSSFLKEAGYSGKEVSKEDCESLMGVYKGSIKNINDKYFGSLEFELKLGQVNNREEFYGKAAWYNNDNVVSEKINNNCGKRVEGFDGRIFNLAADKYIQIYKLKTTEKVAGNFYGVLPNGTTQFIGAFVLKRVDRF